MRNYRTIDAWKKAHALTMDIYRAVQGRRTSFTGLRSQLLRAADAVPSTIVEGCGRNSENEFVRYLDMSHGSAEELDYHMLKARGVGLLTPAEHDSFAERADEVRRMTYCLMREVKKRLDEEEARRKERPRKKPQQTDDQAPDT